MPFKADFGTEITAGILDNGEILEIPVEAVNVFTFRRPDGTAFTRTPTLVLPNILRYVLVAGDLDMAGAWALQGRVTFGNGSWSTEMGNFRVRETL